MMLPAGSTVDDHMGQLLDILEPGDIVVEGGNTYYKDDIRRADLLSAKGIQFVDVGVSGGIWGLEVGYCLMVGGKRESLHHLEPIFKTLAPTDGYLYCGATGS
jgi:6-phosphogluconate dehydrogenase